MKNITIQDQKNRTINIEIGTERGELFICAQKTKLDFFEGENGALNQLVLMIKTGWVPEALKPIFGERVLTFDKEAPCCIAIDAATAGKIAAAYEAQNGELPYMCSERCEYRDIPKWANDCDSGQWNYYMCTDGTLDKRFHGFY